MREQKTINSLPPVEPAKGRHWPTVLIGAKIEDTDMPSFHFWTFEFEGVDEYGSLEFYVWRIAGAVEGRDAAIMDLQERAAKVGIKHIWLHGVRSPMTETKLAEIKRFNELIKLERAKV